MHEHSPKSYQARALNLGPLWCASKSFREQAGSFRVSIWFQVISKSHQSGPECSKIKCTSMVQKVTRVVHLIWTLCGPLRSNFGGILFRQSLRRPKSGPREVLADLSVAIYVPRNPLGFPPTRLPNRLKCSVRISGRSAIVYEVFY